MVLCGVISLYRAQAPSGRSSRSRSRSRSRRRWRSWSCSKAESHRFTTEHSPTLQLSAEINTDDSDEAVNSGLFLRSCGVGAGDSLLYEKKSLVILADHIKCFD